MKLLTKNAIIHLFEHLLVAIYMKGRDVVYRFALAIAIMVVLGGGGLVYFNAKAQQPAQQPWEVRVCEIVDTPHGLRIDLSTPCIILEDEIIPFAPGTALAVGIEGQIVFIEEDGTEWPARNCATRNSQLGGVLIGPAKINPTESEYRALQKCKGIPKPAG